ncbi:MAG: OmpA family protein [Casimicrobiaceae bacterium]
MTTRTNRTVTLPAPLWALCGALLLLGGCVFQSTYNNMLQQQQAIEASLRSEISANQVTIEQLENGIRVRMSSDLLFREGGVELTQAGRAALDKVAPTLNAGSYVIDVVGSTDNVPIGPGLADRYPTNWELAGARAAIVVRHLQTDGVDPTAMRAISDGEYHPIASNDTAAGRAQNRNTSILLKPRN